MKPPNDIISKFVELQVERTSHNLARARKLVTIYERQYGSRGGKRLAYKTDLLRAAVVFTHACLEDFLRSLSAAFLPWSDEEPLNEVPLVGTSGRAQKFLLGKLAMHRGRTVQQLIQESVDAYLEESNYNDTTEIARVLGSMNLRHPNAVALFKDLDEMIKRRHQIVHRADRIEVPGAPKLKARALSAPTVLAWIGATERFVVVLLSSLSDKATKYKRVHPVNVK
jgi:hypothetical protein